MAWKKLGSKKKKGSRISRIVSDLQPPKMADSSLVVETGFPTSLVDLFVKNRGRLKRPKNKKSNQSQPEEQQQEEEEEEEERVQGCLVISDPVVLTCSRDVEPCENGEGKVKVEALHEGLIFGGGDRGINGGEGNCVGPGKRVELVAFLRVVLVLVLGLSTKEMVAWVTLSAFALILLDCWWRRFCWLFQPCSALVRRVLGLVWWVGREKRKEGDVGLGGDGGSVCDGEIQVEECGGEEERKVVVVELELDLVGCEERVVEYEKEQSRGGRIRRKIVKHLVPKKFRGREKKGKMMRKDKEGDLENETSDCSIEDKGSLSSAHNDHGNVDEEEAKRKESISKEDGHGKGCCSYIQELQPDKGTVPADEETRALTNQRKENCGYGILLIAVLAGLAGGRLPAFLLTVGSCLVLDLVGRWRRSLLRDH